MMSLAVHLFTDDITTRCLLASPKHKSDVLSNRLNIPESTHTLGPKEEIEDNLPSPSDFQILLLPSLAEMYSIGVVWIFSGN